MAGTLAAKRRLVAKVQDERAIPSHECNPPAEWPVIPCVVSLPLPSAREGRIVRSHVVDPRRGGLEASKRTEQRTARTSTPNRASGVLGARPGGHLRRRSGWDDVRLSPRAGRRARDGAREAQGLPARLPR